MNHMSESPHKERYNALRRMMDHTRHSSRFMSIQKFVRKLQVKPISRWRWGESILKSEIRSVSSRTQVSIVSGISLSPTESSQNANISTAKSPPRSNSSSYTTATSQCRVRLWTSSGIGHRIGFPKDAKVRTAAKSTQSELWVAR